MQHIPIDPEVLLAAAHLFGEPFELSTDTSRSPEREMRASMRSSMVAARLYLIEDLQPDGRRLHHMCHPAECLHAIDQFTPHRPQCFLALVDLLRELLSKPPRRLARSRSIRTARNAITAGGDLGEFGVQVHWVRCSSKWSDRQAGLLTIRS